MSVIFSSNDKTDALETPIMHMGNPWKKLLPNKKNSNVEMIIINESWEIQELELQTQELVEEQR
jgi:hypothetical protein